MSTVDFTKTARNPMCELPHNDTDLARRIAALDTLGNAKCLLRGMEQRLVNESPDEALILNIVLAAMEHIHDLIAVQSVPRESFNEALASGKTWATRLATIVSGHEQTGDVDGDIEHVQAENPADMFTWAEIFAAFQNSTAQRPQEADLSIELSVGKSRATD